MAAKLESELVVYGPFHKTFFDFLSKFRHRYINLDINLTYYAAHPITVVNKVRNEVNCGIPTADVVMLPHYTTLMLKTSGHLTEYVSPESKPYAAMFKDKDKQWSAIAVEPTNAIYNRSIIPQSDVPTTFEGLANPGLKGKVAIQSVQDWSEGMYSYFWFATMMKKMGERKFEAWAKEFLKVKPATFACYHNMQKYVARGDYAIGLPLPMIKVGWEIETLNMVDVPLTASMRSIAIVKGGAHQNTAELFYDHLMSEYWQQRMGKDYEGLIPTRPGATMKYNAPFRNPEAITYFPNEAGVREAFSKDSPLETFKQLGLP